MPAEAIEAALGAKLERASAGDPISAPGMLASHYAPRLPLRLDASSVEPDEALLAFGPARIAGADRAAAVRNLSPTGDLVEAAANLFAFLAELDRSGAIRDRGRADPARRTGRGDQRPPRHEQQRRR